MAAEVLVPLGSFLFLFGIIYIFFNTRKQERMALIEKGLDATVFDGKGSAKKYRALQLGLLFVGISLGILTGYFVDQATDMEEPAPYFMMIFLFGGIGLLIYYFVINKRENQEEN